MPISKIEDPAENPILIFSLCIHSPNEDEDIGAHHLMVVDEIIDALSKPQPFDHTMHGFLLEISKSSKEPDDSMVLSHF